MMSKLIRLSALVLLLGGFALDADTAESAPPEWAALAGVEEIQVLSENPDGAKRETTVWLAVLDGEGYIRTGDTSWYPNLERKPEIAVRIDGREYAVTAQLVSEQTLIDRVVAVFAEKYGWSDTIRGWVIRSAPHIVKLVPRTA
ncbi:MAG: DUF2255 family protein [Myxococcota bacterium]